MYTRFITYDLNYASNDDYNELYKLLEGYKSKKITESTYQIDTSESLEVFKNKFYKATHNGDNVKVIIKTDKGMEVRVIR